jgi:hypothetical protein
MFFVLRSSYSTCYFFHPRVYCTINCMLIRYCTCATDRRTSERSNAEPLYSWWTKKVSFSWTVGIYVMRHFFCPPRVQMCAPGHFFDYGSSYTCSLSFLLPYFISLCVLLMLTHFSIKHDSPYGCGVSSLIITVPSCLFHFSFTLSPPLQHALV